MSAGTGLGQGCTALCRAAQHAFYCGTGTGEGWHLHGRESTAAEVVAHGPIPCPYCAEPVAERLEHAALGEWECHDRPAFDWPKPGRGDSPTPVANGPSPLLHSDPEPAPKCKGEPR